MTDRRPTLDPSLVRRAIPNKSTIDRIGSQIQPQPNGCWIWGGNPDSYGHPRHHGKTVQAHRYVYQILVGPIPDRHVLHHHCETPGCVNPAHLEPMTNGEHRALHYRLKHG